MPGMTAENFEAERSEPGTVPAGSLATLGERMKALEQRARMVLPPRTHTIVRVDGRAFHGYTAGLDRPFDAELTAAMDATAIALSTQVSGTVCAYTQSDEISLLLVDYAHLGTQPWLGGVAAKIISLTAAIATAAFAAAHTHPRGRGPALFDSRAFTIEDPYDVGLYFQWRAKDAYRNAVNMICDAHLGKNSTFEVGTHRRLQMLADVGVTLDDYPAGSIHGRLITPGTVPCDVSYVDRRTGERRVAEAVKRRVWNVDPAPASGIADVITGLLPARSAKS